MTNFVRLVAAAGLAGVALAGCAAPPDAQPASEESALATKLPVKIAPRPAPLPFPGGGTIWDPPVYPDYGLAGDGCGACGTLPATIDLENWSGGYTLWGSHSGSIMPYWAYNTADRVRGDLNYHRMELFGIDSTTNAVVWHAFGPPDPVTGGIPEALLRMAGTEDPYCTISRTDSGSFSSGKPPKDPPRPPDGTAGGCIMFCPAMTAEYDLSQRLLGCNTIGD